VKFEYLSILAIAAAKINSSVDTTGARITVYARTQQNKEALTALTLPPPVIPTQNRYRNDFLPEKSFRYRNWFFSTPQNRAAPLPGRGMIGEYPRQSEKIVYWNSLAGLNMLREHLLTDETAAIKERRICDQTIKTISKAHQ
jgi:hypothetical protein